MANIDLTQLQNAEPLNLSLGELSTASGATDALITTAQNEVGNFWFTSSIVILFLVLNWYFYRRDANFQLDIARAILTSSVWSFFISAAFLLSGIVTTIYPVIWFSTLSLVTWISVNNLKSRGA